jgi:hypothetical protein
MTRIKGMAPYPIKCKNMPITDATGLTEAELERFTPE